MARATLIAALAATLAGTSAQTALAASCEDLLKLSLPHTHVDRAEPVAAGAFVVPPPPGSTGPTNAAAANAGRGDNALTRSLKALPAFCRVSLTSTPSPDSDIKIEVWLPQSGWNGKFQGVGNGGWAGVIGWQALATGVAAGYATAATDTGHVGNTAAFAMGHPEKLVDMGYRAIHEMTVAGKNVTDAFYGNLPQLSFFNGCSQGGRQAITEAMRYPADYNGIIAGAPAIYNMQMHVARIGVNAMANRSAASNIPREKYEMLHEAVLNACDGFDGVKDGVLENPLACTFDPQALECKGSDAPTCLTAPQVETMRRLYSPMKIGSSAMQAPLLQPGTELGFATLAGPRPLNLVVETMRYVVFKDPAWEIARFNPATDFDRAMLADSDKVLGLTDPNLKPFFDRGGKLLMYHGWQDPQVPAQGSVTYYNDVLRTVGRGAAGSSIALFMMPGVNHCRSGPGPDTFDKMAAIESFVATGKAPARIEASHLDNGKVDRTRPLCPYPQVAVWNGTGSTDDAKNFSCAAR